LIPAKDHSPLNTLSALSNYKINLLPFITGVSYLMPVDFFIPQVRMQSSTAQRIIQ